MAVLNPPYSGPAILAGGYRAFFFLAALWALLSLVFWVAYLTGLGGNSAGIDMLQWHAHGLVFGYGGAVVAGFALTAIPNWTGRPPVRGLMLGALVLPWLVARISEILLLAGFLAEPIRFASEMIFFVLFISIAAREIMLGKNWRNLKVIAVFALLGAAAMAANLARLGMVSLPFPGWQAGLSVLLLLITIIGGRIIPAFTGNWLRGQGAAVLPQMFNRFDGLAIFVVAGVLLAFLSGADGLWFVAAAGFAAALHFIRLIRWQGLQTLASPIVAVLHISYLWVPIGFLLLALSSAGLVPLNAALHAWTIGGVGSTTLAVMSRASLGHAGLPLADSRMLSRIYTAINLAAVLRLAAALWPQGYDHLIKLSAVFWCAAFLLFLVRFAPLYFSKGLSSAK